MSMKARVEPYIQMAMHHLLIDFFLLIFVVCVLIYLRNKNVMIFCLIIMTLYFVLKIFAFYRFVIVALKDLKNKDTVTEALRFITSKDKLGLFSGDKTGRSLIGSLYPNDIMANEIVIITENSEGKKVKINSVMSFRRLMNIVFLEDDANLENNELVMTYLKRSKILIKVDIAEKDLEKLNSKKRRALDKQLHFINSNV